MSGGHKRLTEQVQELKTNRGEEVESLSIFREVRLCRKGKKFGWRGCGVVFFFFFNGRCFSMFIINGYNPAKWGKLIM